jgi:hypothetical protein
MREIMSSEEKKSNNETVTLVAIPEVLTSVSHEIRLLSDGVNDLQGLISNLVVAGAFDGGQSVYELQTLDRISQSLDALSDYLGGASKLALPEWKIDVVEASRGVKLAEICDRLASVKREAGSETAAGDFEDFALTG